MISLSSFLLNLPEFPYKNTPEFTLKFTLISKLKLAYLGSYGVCQEILGEDIRKLRENGWMYGVFYAPGREIDEVGFTTAETH